MLLGPSEKGQKRQKKAEKARFRPISGKGGQTPLKPPFVTPPFAAAQFGPSPSSADRELSEFLSAYCLYAEANSPSFAQN